MYSVAKKLEIKKNIHIYTYNYKSCLNIDIVCLCLYHCLCSLSTLRCGVERLLPITNETVLAVHINLSVGSACHNALCSTNDATKAHMAAVHNLRTLCFIDTFVSAMSDIVAKDIFI